MSAGRDTAFSEAQYLQIYPDGVEHHFWHQARGAILLRYLARYRAEPMLEIGAGRGLVLAAFRRQGWQAEGVELGIASPRWPDLPIRYGQDALALPAAERARYQAIGLFDVIEHLPDRVSFLQTLRETFPSLRYLYVTVPAPPDLWSNYDTFCGHYLRYDLPTLKEELTQAGYQVHFIRYFFHLLYWVIWGNLRFRKSRSEYVSIPRGVGRWVHWAAAQYFSLEGRLLPGRWRGTSLIAVASPNPDAPISPPQ